MTLTESLDNVSYQLPFFPLPMEGELLYSVICRYHMRSGQSLKNNITRIEPTLSNFLSFTSYHSGSIPIIAKCVSDRHPWKNPVHILLNNTLLSYCIFFDYFPAMELLESFNFFIMDMFNSIRRLSIANYCICSSCVEEDINSFGFSYFHCEHQIPFASICWRHGDVLLKRSPNTPIIQCDPFQRKLPEDYIYDKSIKLEPVHKEFPQNIKIIKWVLDQGIYMYKSKRSKIENCYGVLMQLLGCNTHADLLSKENINRFVSIIEDRFGPTALHWLGLNMRLKNLSDENVYQKIINSFSNNARNYYPISYILMIATLFGSIEEFETKYNQNPKLIKNGN